MFARLRATKKEVKAETKITTMSTRTARITTFLIAGLCKEIFILGTWQGLQFNKTSLPENYHQQANDYQNKSYHEQNIVESAVFEDWGHKNCYFVRNIHNSKIIFSSIPKFD